MSPQTSTPLTAEQMAAWTAHVLAEFPKEACAYLVDGEIFPVGNVSDNPTQTFNVDALDRLRAEAKGQVTGFLHSHPATPLEAASRPYPTFWPSSHDMRSWLADNVRWGISACDGDYVTEPVWLDEDHVAPLEGRPFIHGIWDCYSAVRDYFRVNKGVTLKNYPRGMEWWNAGEDLYDTQFAGAGFVELPSTDLKPGDVALMAIHSKGVICHAAVLHDLNTLFHHTYSRSGTGLSCYVPFGRWEKHVIKYVRYSPSVNTAQENNKNVANHPPSQRTRKVQRRTNRVRS